MRIPAGPLALLSAIFLFALPAIAADCAAPPGPGVDWRRCLLDSTDLSEANLTGAVLRDTSLQRATLRGAKLVQVVGPRSRFVSADLTGADLTGANLREADLTRATLRDAKLVGADLRQSRLFRADLRGADLTGAKLAGADFSGALLSGARWTDGERICAGGSVGSCQ